MSKFLLKLYNLTPKLFFWLLKKNPKLSLDLNNHLFLLIKRKNIYDILPFLDLDFLKACDVNFHKFSYFFFEYLFGVNSDTTNRIVLKVCLHLIEIPTDIAINEKEYRTRYLFSGEANWLYSMIELTTMKSAIAEDAYSLLQEKLDEDFLDVDAVITSQLSYLVDKNPNICYTAFILTYGSYKS